MVARLETSLFRLLLDAAPDATVIVDESATIVLANAQVANVLGWSQDELVGQHIEVLVPGRLREVHRVRRSGFLGEPTVRPMGVGRNMFARHKDGHEPPVEISQTQGAGLGLPIAQKIVHAHGGSIDVTSELGVGTVFRVHLPYAASRPSSSLG